MYLYGLLLIFISIFLLVISSAGLVLHKRMQVQKRLNIYGRFFDENVKADPYKGIPVADEDISQKSKPKRQERGLLKKRMLKIEAELAKADILLHPGEYLILVAMLEILLGIILFFITKQLLMGILGVALGMIISSMVVKRKKRKRIMKLNQQLPDTITLISNSLKAGNSFPQASEMVAQDMRPPISMEFQKMVRQNSMGMPIEEALKGLGERIESQDFDLVITAILIQRQVGGNLAEVLDNITHVIRERVKLKQELKSKTAQARMSGFVLVLLPPGVGFATYLMNPKFIGILFTNTLGWAMVIVAIIMQIIGIIFIKKILNVSL